LAPSVLLVVSLAASISLLNAGLHVYFRDVRYIVQALLTVWFYVTPVVYPLGLTHGLLATAIKLNPATGVIELFRASVGAADPGWLTSVGVACAWVVVTSALALYLHCRFNRVFADLL
jgi:ABC-type polysaccharide/polyol phosphate export permease